MREAIVAIIVSFICVAAHAQEICTEQDGSRSCKVERPEQPELPKHRCRWMPLAPKRHCASRCTTTAGVSGVHYGCCQQTAACCHTWDQGKPSAAATIRGTAPGRKSHYSGDRRQRCRTRFDLHI
jgi:hypothetical protein